MAKEKEFVVVQDAAHILLTFDGKPRSFLQTPGAMDVGVEVHSMSKGYDMIGWRMGFVCGHERIVSAFADVKDNSDSGQFIATQKAAAAALDDDSIPQRINAKYRRRLEKLVATLRECGFDCEMPGGTYFLYTKSPSGTQSGEKFAAAEDATRHLIEQFGIVTVPWDDAGAYSAIQRDLRGRNRSGRRRLDGRNQTATRRCRVGLVIVAVTRSRDESRIDLISSQRSLTATRKKPLANREWLFDLHIG